MGELEEGTGQCTPGKRIAGGLYRKEDEHDSCGIGFVADIKGRPSHTILERGLEVLERMEHRGAESADNKTGDGSGVLLQIPHDYYKKLIPNLPPPGAYGTGLVFLPGPLGDPQTARLHESVLTLIEDTARASAFRVIAWREVPTDGSVIGSIARSAEPVIKQLVLAPESGPGPGTAGEGVPDLELGLYIFRKRLEKTLRSRGDLGRWAADCYLPSLSSRTIVYKGMLMPNQLKRYYPELRDGDVKTAVALVHSRFSTNTFPAWSLAQPFRMVSHNGEINTLTGNRFWMAAREPLFSHPRFGEDLRDILPVLEPEKSDSASFDNILELLVLSGRSLPHALMMLIPESWNDKNPIPQELKDFYEYHACIMEPWDGPASMVFCDGRYVGGTLDRNGLRPSRYTITKDDLIVMASETGVQDFKPSEVVYKGRLLPGKLLLVDMAEGRIIPDAEVKRDVCRRGPYAGWVGENLLTLDQGETDPKAEPDPGMPVPEILFMERAMGYTREDRDRLLIPMAETGQEPTSSMGTDTPLAVFSGKSQRVYAYFKQVFAQVTNPPIDSIREDLVMTLTSFIGPQENLLDETGAHCRRIKVFCPILTPEELERLLALSPGDFPSKTLDATFYVPLLGGEKERDGSPPRSSLEEALDRLVGEAVKAAGEGISLLILSDRAGLPPEAGRCAVPALLAVGAVHHGLIRAGLRIRTSIIAETAEPRELMHFALLFGYGADLVVPYGVLASIAAICRGPDGSRIGTYGEAAGHYLKGLRKAMLKVMSKMGTSTLRSYRGAQIFEAIGLGD
ncbi:MAG: glutamate synthase subunit alpha, partial [Spirochaetaceae bacterium]|nr:glutamate synthase subunit alpha [Spirochaetaceae bacterium]